MSFASNDGKSLSLRDSRSLICWAVGSGASHTTTFAIAPLFSLTTHSSLTKSLSLEQTSSSLVATCGVRFGGAPFAVSQTILPLTVTHWAWTVTHGTRANRANKTSLRIEQPSQGVWLEMCLRRA